MSSTEHRRDPRAESLREIKDTYIDYGPTLSDGYGTAIVRLLARDPETIFAYWEGGGALRIVDVTTGFDRFFDVANLGSWYAGAEPEHEYEAEIGNRSHDRFVAAARSNRVKTPRRGPAVLIDSEWPLTPEEEAEFKKLTGLTRLQVAKPAFGSGKF